MNGQIEQHDDVLHEIEETFIKPDEAVEVEVNDEDIPMDEDDYDDEVEIDHCYTDQLNMGQQREDNASKNSIRPKASTTDMSMQTISSHKASSVYAVDSFLDKVSNSLTIITGGGDDRAFLHNLDNDNLLRTIPLSHSHTDTVSSVASNLALVSEDLVKTPKYLAVGSYDGSIVLYNPDDGKMITVLDGPTDVEFLSFHPKGGMVLLAGSISDSTVWMYHLPTSKCLQVFVGHECNSEGGGVTGGTFTPDGKFALSIGMDGSLRVWAPRTGRCRHVFRLTTSKATTGGEEEMLQGGFGLICLAVNGGTDGQLAITGDEGGIAHVVHIQGKKVLTTLHHFDALLGESKTEGVGNINDDGDDLILTSIEAVAFASKSVNPNWVATGGSNGILKVWDLSIGQGQCRQICSVANETNDKDLSIGGITRVVWHPLLPIIFASYTDGVVRVWDARNGFMLHAMTGGGNRNGQINDMSIVFFGMEQGLGSANIVTANDNGAAKIFHVDISTILQT